MANTRKPNNPTPFTLADISAKATPNERVVSLCLAGGLFADHQRLEADLEEAQSAELVGSSGRKLSEVPASTKIARALVALETEMKASTFDFTFRQLSRAEWKALMADHPTKKPTEERVNVDTFSPAAVVACCVQPKGFDDPKVFTAFWDNLSAGQQSTLFGAAWDVNEGGISVPFSVNASVTLSTSEATSGTASR